MKNRSILFAFSLSIAVNTAAVAQQAIPTIPQSEVGRHVGDVATVCGTIVNIGCFGADRRIWFHLDEPFWNGMSLVVVDADRPRLGRRLGRFWLQPVCGTGKIERHDKGFLLETKPEDLQPRAPASILEPRLQGDVFTVCDGGVSAPVILRERKPQYTREALRAKKEGKLVVVAVVLPDGRVGDVVVAVSLDQEYGLDREAVAAVREWRFSPGTLDGRSVAVVIAAELVFNLPDKD